MDNKIIRLEDINGKSLDTIVDLYKQGYILEENINEITSIKQLQPSVITLSLVTVLVAGILAGVTVMYLSKRLKKWNIKNNIDKK